MFNSYYSIVIVRKGTKVSNVSQSICPKHVMEFDICTSVGVWSPCLLAFLMSMTPHSCSLNCGGVTCSSVGAQLLFLYEFSEHNPLWNLRFL